MYTYALDPRTTVLLGSITSGLMAIFLSLLARATPLPVPGLWNWVAGAWLVFGGLAMLGLRDWITHLATITVGNGAGMLGYILWLAGTHQYLGQRIRWAPWLLAWVLATAGVSWFIFVEPSFRMRVVIVAGLCCFVSARHALLWLRHPRAERFGSALGVSLVVGWLLVHCTVYGLRTLHAAWYPQGQTGLLTPDTIQVIYTGSLAICNLMLVIGYATIAYEHVRARIEDKAIHDPLTGALNRQALMDSLQRESARSTRSGLPFSVAMIDVDHFKRINDRHGHPVGDRVLVHLSRRMAALVRPNDVVARYGGEEFVVVMPETTLGAALQAGQRILMNAVQVEDQALPGFTISIGLAQWSSADTSVETVIARADAALYAAKANGRNRVEVGGSAISVETPIAGS
ncbi:GGDEF domain-containing protein [Pseudorhodoferax sp.]|uniref:GGDEF domain-containing protein n=1 Tax=Pseudorhodoferax sp. TaxID=1993553 RepID=UPI002DD64CCD|nr:GGDEF domain-containing protein [Pseudorhodoferax sp.]